MKSIFDLPQSTSELPSLNQGMSRLTYEQVPPLRDVTSTNFPNGRIEMRWEVSGNRWWIPARSYIRLRAKLTNGNGSRINTSSETAFGGDKAPNMGLMGNLFQSLEFKIAQKVVSRISDRVAQVDALYNRTCHSKSQLDTWLSDTNWWQPDYRKRNNLIAVDGVELKDNSAYPQLGGFNIVNNSETATQVGFTVGVGNNTVAYDTATELMTFAAGAGVAIDLFNTQIIHEGDIISLTEGTFTVVAQNDSTSLTVAPVNPALATFGARVLTNGDLFTRVFKQSYNKSPQRSNIELIWKPPLGIFQCPYALPAGRYELSMIPQSSGEYMKKAIESFTNDIAQRTQLNDGGADPSEIQFEVINMNLYVATAEGPRVDDLTYMLDIEDINCQVENITGTGFQQKNFDVEPSTTALTCAFQSQSAGLNTLYSQSKFKFPSNLALYPSGELALTRFFMRYGLDQKPSPDFDPSYSSPTSYITELFAETQLYSGQKFNDGGCETLQDWIDRGAYIYFAWPQDGTAESTRVNVNYSFDENLTVSNVARVLLFNHFKTVAEITVKQGRVVDVVLQQG